MAPAIIYHERFVYLGTCLIAKAVIVLPGSSLTVRLVAVQIPVSSVAVPKMLSPLEGYIIAMTTQAFLLGVYLASFLLCLRWLTFSDDGGNLRKGINWPFLIIAIVIFAFSVTDSAIYLQSIIWVSEGRSPTMYMTIINVRNVAI